MLARFAVAAQARRFDQALGTLGLHVAMYIIAYIFSFLLLIGSGGWFISNPDWEPGIAVLTFFASLIATYLNDDARKAKSKAYWEKRKADVATGLSRITREAGNLQHMADGKAFKSESHRKAVERTSFELLTQDLSPLSVYWRYSALVRRVLTNVRGVQAASSKSVTKLLSLIESLESRLRSDPSQLD